MVTASGSSSATCRSRAHGSTPLRPPGSTANGECSKLTACSPSRSSPIAFPTPTGVPMNLISPFPKRPPDHALGASAIDEGGEQPTPTVNANGVAIGVESFGDDGAPLVLLAGGTTML